MWSPAVHTDRDTGRGLGFWGDGAMPSLGHVWDILVAFRSGDAD